MKKISTFSIVARDPQTGELGVAVQSKFLAVGSAVCWAKSGAGAIATQALANLDFGDLGLKLLEKGYSAGKVLEALLALDDSKEERQIGIVDAMGNSAAFTGKNCFNWAGHTTGMDYSCQGNILISEDTVKALEDTFLNSKGALAERLVLALEKAQEAGGDKRGRQSAALLVVKEKGSYGGYNDRYIDLRVDDDPEPIKKLRHLLELHDMYFSRTKPEETLEVNDEVGRIIQEALKELGYYKGSITGIYNAETVKAFGDFCGIENFEERICQGSFVDSRVLEFLKKKAGI
ncbi:MAG TPA: DUF1028 domain-containing protein [Clostridia bacterium]|nr:DUF1028 domain-containing protein [Clostridia bacterium]